MKHNGAQLGMKRLTVIFFSVMLVWFLIPLQAFGGTIVDKSGEGYLLCVPKASPAGEKYPLLVCLPGYGVAARQDISNWAFPADKQGFLVIDFDVAYHLIGSPEDVEALYNRIEQAIAATAEEYPADTRRVYIAGTSAGGMMTLTLSVLHPERFLASGVVCGALLRYGARENLPHAYGLKFYLVHGRKDKRVPISDFYATKKLLEKNGALVESHVLPEGEHTLPSSVYRETVEWLSTVK